MIANLLDRAHRARRRGVCIALLLCSLGLASLPSMAQFPTAPTAQQGRQISLTQQLTLGLRARTKADKAFINKVVMRVEAGTLPRSLVDSTFFWSRERARKRSFTRRLRPIVFFQPALIARAKSLGITL